MGDVFYVSQGGTVRLQLLVTDLSGRPVERGPKLLSDREVAVLSRLLGPRD